MWLKCVGGMEHGQAIFLPVTDHTYTHAANVWHMPMSVHYLNGTPIRSSTHEERLCRIFFV